MKMDTLLSTSRGNGKWWSRDKPTTGIRTPFGSVVGGGASGILYLSPVSSRLLNHRSSMLTAPSKTSNERMAHFVLSLRVSGRSSPESPLSAMSYVNLASAAKATVSGLGVAVSVGVSLAVSVRVRVCVPVACGPSSDWHPAASPTPRSDRYRLRFM